MPKVKLATKPAAKELYTMNTLTINSKAAQTLSNAAAKARQEKPLVRKTATYGIYTVIGSTGKEYTVKCNSATKEITCNCKAYKPCYHIAAVAPLHSYIARQKQEAERAATEAGQEVEEDPFIICGCGRDGFSFFNGEWYCIECIKEMAEAEDAALEHDRECLFG